MTSPPFASDDELTALLWVWARTDSTKCVAALQEELLRDINGIQAQANTMPVALAPFSCFSKELQPVRSRTRSAVPLEPCHAQVAVVAAPEPLGKGVVFNFQLGYL